MDAYRYSHIHMHHVCYVYTNTVIGHGPCTRHAYVTGPVKINHVSTKTCRFFVFALLITICTNKIKSLTLMQNLMGFLLNFREMRYVPHSELKI